MRIKQNAKYVPDLRRLIGDCEANYLRFLRLLPMIKNEDDWVFGVEAKGLNPQDVESLKDALSQVTISVVERSKYTTTISLTQDSTVSDWIPKPSITVRLYHDAQVAEVLSFQRRRHIRQSYSYPNDKMYQRDEKAQLNAFLGEWLDFCLASGCALDLELPGDN